MVGRILEHSGGDGGGGTFGRDPETVGRDPGAIGRDPGTFPKIIGSEIIIILAFMCSEKRIPFAFAEHYQNNPGTIFGKTVRDNFW